MIKYPPMFKVGDKVLASIQVDYNMQELEVVIIEIIPAGVAASLAGECYVVDAGEYHHHIYKRNILKKL